MYMYPCKTASLRMNLLQKTFYLNAFISEIRRSIRSVSSPDRMLGAIACGVLDHGMTVNRLIKHVLYYASKSICKNTAVSADFIPHKWNNFANICYLIATQIASEIYSSTMHKS